MHRNIRCYVWFFCIAGVLCSVTPLIAQIDRGTIQGLVKDPSGAVIPGASVKIIQIATNSTYGLVTNGEGLYIAPNLPVATYKVVIQAEGFSTFSREPIEVRAHALGFGTNYDENWLEYRYGFNENLTWIHGKHTMKYGFSVQLNSEDRRFGTQSESLSFLKSVDISERVKFNLSADLINPFNIVRWGNPSTLVGLPTFGQITTTQGARQIQINVGLSF